MKKLGRILVHTPEPGHVHRVDDAGDLLHVGFVGLGEKLEERNPVTHHQPVLVGDIGPHRKGRLEHGENAEDQEREDHR